MNGEFTTTINLTQNAKLQAIAKIQFLIWIELLPVVEMYLTNLTNLLRKTRLWL